MRSPSANPCRASRTCASSARRRALCRRHGPAAGCCSGRCCARRTRTRVIRSIEHRTSRKRRPGVPRRADGRGLAGDPASATCRSPAATSSADGSPMYRPRYPALVTDRVRWVGDYVAFVVAETRHRGGGRGRADRGRLRAACRRSISAAGRRQARRAARLGRLPGQHLLHPSRSATSQRRTPPSRGADARRAPQLRRSTG